MSTKYFYFTIGPVQGFVAQARRTRDFWAGSFILSWLAGVAMQSVIAQEGNKREVIQFPSPNKNFMDWLIGQGAGDAPKQGCIPNRFKAKVSEDFKPEIVKENVIHAWKALANKIWEEDGLEEICRKHLNTRTIWNEQIDNFWEISWVLTETEDSDLLDRRKNIRSHFMPKQAGVKCSMMGQWQELSGEFPVSKDFWRNVCKENKFRKELNLSEFADNEYLCATAFIKRRFVHWFENIDVEMKVDSQNINKWRLKGWKLSKNVPSVAYMAAVHWMEKVIKNENESTIRNLLQAANWIGAEYDEWNTHIKCLEEACKNKVDKKFIALDGSAFFPAVLNNKNIYNTDYSQKMLVQLSRLEKIKEPPSPFYAVLMMDGDSLGSKMSNSDNQKPISTALNNFTQEVPDLVKENNGFLIYAGGDDVLAILPLEDVLKCAKDLRDKYIKSFEIAVSKENEERKKEGKANIKLNSTISAAIEFVHIKEPLTMVLKDAHHLLDEIAKEKCGRDSIAVRVWKGSGKALEWAIPFECALEEGKFEIEQIANEFRDKKTQQEADFSSKFFYKIREHFDILNPQKIDEENYEKPILDFKQAVDLLTADYLNSGVYRGQKINDEMICKAKDKVKSLLRQCRLLKRIPDKSKEEWEKEWEKLSIFKVDGALLVRFLAQYWQKKG